MIINKISNQLFSYFKLYTQFFQFTFLCICLSFFTEFSNGQTIRVLSPNGGEKWIKGQKNIISWQANGIGNNVKIMLKRTTTSGRGGWYVITENTLNDGVFEYQVPAEIPGSNETYKIFVMSLDENIQDNSDGLFQIMSSPVGTLLIPGAIMGLQHNLNQQKDNNLFVAMFTADAEEQVQKMVGGDRGAPNHRGYEWWMVKNYESVPTNYKLPPGIVFALKHSQNQSKESITLFGNDPVTGSNYLMNEMYKKEVGGDLGAPSGHGFFWYESTGKNFSDWNLLKRLPKWTVVGLKHSRNQKNKKFVWNGKVYDPANPQINPPEGFQRRSGGDLGAGSGEGFCWYEKVTGPEVVIIPTLKIKLERSIFFSPNDNQNIDIDRDFLVDSLENKLAETFCPYLKFDVDERARESHEPVTLFQVRTLHPSQYQNNYIILIKWAFLFKRDGGYGPDSYCKDSHGGDNDEAFYEIITKDNGVTWNILRIVLSPWKTNSLQWPDNTRLEIYDLTHPIIYMSAHKHHQYFNRDYDHHDSHYSSWDCNDDVNGLGDCFLADLHSVFSQDYKYFNNVGEYQYHTSPPFVNDLGDYFDGYSAWGNKNFYKVHPLIDIWIK